MKYHNTAFESAIIGCVAVKPDLIEVVTNEITPDDFEDGNNKILLWILTRIFKDNKPIDVKVVADYLKKYKRYNGTYDHFLDIVEETSTSAGFQHFIDEIKELREKNRLFLLFQKLDRNLRSEQIPVDNSIQDIIQYLNTVDSTAKKESLADVVKDYIKDQNGVFYLSDLCRDLIIKDRKKKHAAVVILSRLVEKGDIETSGIKSGCYRKVDRNFEIVEFTSIKGNEQPLDIRLPFGLERHIEVFPNDILIYSGQPQVGKTAIMFECIRLNYRRHKVFYFTKELSIRSVKRRVKKYAGDTEWDFGISDDFENFVDVLQPNAVNVIDYIEVDNGEYYKIPGILVKIHNRLKKLNSIAVVALQKNPDYVDKKTGKITRSKAIGGHQTLAKANLFCTLTPDYPHGAIMRIEKGKNPRNDENIDGFEIGYKIVQGINLIPQGIWAPEIKI